MLRPVTVPLGHSVHITTVPLFDVPDDDLIEVWEVFRGRFGD
jgi:hypothetical protein